MHKHTHTQNPWPLWCEMEGYRGRYGCKVKRENCQKNASSTVLQDDSSHASLHHAGRAQRGNISIQASQKRKSTKILHMFAVWTHTAAKSRNRKISSSGVWRNYKNLPLSRFYIFSLCGREIVFFFWTRPWRQHLINTWLWGFVCA